MSENLTRSGVKQVLRTNYLEVVFGLILLVLLFDLVNSLWTGSLTYSRLATFVWDGLIVGLALGLAGIGLSMTYSILGFANVAHGDTMTTGAFVGWGVVFVLFGYGDAALGELLLLGVGGNFYASDLGISVLSHPLAVLFGILITGAVTAGIAIVVDRFVYKPLRDASSIMVLITSVGVAFLLRYLIVFFYKPSQRSLVVQPESVVLGSIDSVPVIAASRSALENGESIVEFPFALGGGFGASTLIQVNSHEVLLVVVTVFLMVGLHLLLQRTRLGKSMRAMADNPDLARSRGIPTERVIRWTWIIGGSTTGIAGFLVVLERGTMSFQFGWLLLLLIFAAVVLGGIGSIYGAIVGGLVIGLTTTVSLVWLPEATFARPMAFLIMILVLVVRPQGLFGGRIVG